MAGKTYKPNKRKRATTHGFLTRTKTTAGKKTTLRRRRKGRARLAP
jgi:large subunit ribosomal protein L34